MGFIQMLEGRMNSLGTEFFELFNVIWCFKEELPGHLPVFIGIDVMTCKELFQLGLA